jgi:hypothetical protein
MFRAQYCLPVKCSIQPNSKVKESSQILRLLQTATRWVMRLSSLTKGWGFGSQSVRQFQCAAGRLGRKHTGNDAAWWEAIVAIDMFVLVNPAMACPVCSDQSCGANSDSGSITRHRLGSGHQPVMTGEGALFWPREIKGCSYLGG